MSRRDENDSTRESTGSGTRSGALSGTSERSGSAPDASSTQDPHDPGGPGTSANPGNAFAAEFLEALRRREHHPAVPEADFAGPWHVLRLFGDRPPVDSVRHGCFGAGERAPRLIFQEPDLAHLGATALTLAQRPARFRFQKGADGRNHLMHDGYPVATVAPIVPQDSSLPTDLTRLSDLRAHPQALAHFLVAVPDEVLERAGAIVMELLRGEGG